MTHGLKISYQGSQDEESRSQEPGIFSLKWENILNLDVNGSQLNTNFPKLKGLQKLYNIMCIKII